MKNKRSLSICIPTLNRAELLRTSLKIIKKESSPYLDQIEIIVADNASTDHTKDVVLESGLPIKYGRQVKTIGFAKNLAYATSTLASGEYVWIVGDDDSLLPGSIGRILDSIAKSPDIDYHYLNFGWIDVKWRERLFHENNFEIPDLLFRNLQFDLREYRKLPKLEDLASFPGKNPSALFSGIFCFVTRRTFFEDARKWLKPSDSLDGSSILLDDCFPHALSTIPRVTGKPIAYIGEPCVLQGINGWEWGNYAVKNMIFGTYQLFIWIEERGFDSDAMSELWKSYRKMAGMLFARMLHKPEKNKGIDIVLKESIPSSAKNEDFWLSFNFESKAIYETEYDATNICRWASQVLEQNPFAKIGLWGITGRGTLFLENFPYLDRLSWVGDREPTFHGTLIEGTELTVLAPNSIEYADVDALVICTRREHIEEVVVAASAHLRAGTILISADGVTQSRITTQENQSALPQTGQPAPHIRH